MCIAKRVMMPGVNCNNHGKDTQRMLVAAGIVLYTKGRIKIDMARFFSLGDARNEG